jgi:hypothetical protein
MQEFQIKDWKTFTEFIENTVKDFPNVTDNYIHYRGQTNVNWKLTPSLTRIVNGDEISERKASGYESQAQLDFISQVHLLDTKISYDRNLDPASMLVDMQHYSCPTRLLDWSQSPYVALYFAINENFDSNAALFAWDWRYYKRNLNEAYPKEQEIKSAEILKFTKHDIIEMIFAVKLNERIVRQQGAFSVSNNIIKNHDDLIIDLGKKVDKPSGLYKLEIPAHLKLEFLARLKLMNISPESLFPGLDGLGRTIKETLLLRKWKGK